MKKRLIFLLTIITSLFIIAACSSGNTDDTDSFSDSTDGSEENAMETEKDLMGRLLEELNNNVDSLLKDEGFTLHYESLDYYRQQSYIGEYTEEYGYEYELEIDLVDASLAASKVDFKDEPEDYELSNGMKGKLGIEDTDELVFAYEGDEYTTLINLGEMDLEEGKSKLDALEFRSGEITEENLKEMIGFDYEDVKYFDNKDTNYEVSDLFVNTGIDNSLMVRYYYSDSPLEGMDHIDISVSKEEFRKDDFYEIDSTTTAGGKEIEVIERDLYVEWFWEDDGYYYLIDGNYSEDSKLEKEQKEYIFEVIDMMTKSYGE